MNRPYVAQSSSEASAEGVGGAGGVSASAKPELAGGAAGGGAGTDELILLLWNTPQALPYDGQSFWSSLWPGTIGTFSGAGPANERPHSAQVVCSPDPSIVVMLLDDEGDCEFAVWMSRGFVRADTAARSIRNARTVDAARIGDGEGARWLDNWSSSCSRCS